MLDVGLTTLKNVVILLTFVTMGFVLYRSRKFPEEAAKVISSLTTLLFLPAYNIHSLSQSFTLEKLGEKTTLLGYGVLFAVATVVLGLVLARIFSKDPVVRRSLTYAFTFSNYGYFGFPLIQGVFGDAMLADAILFTVPYGIVCGTFGFALFSPEKKINWKKVLLTPTVISVFAGMAIGLSGWEMPQICRNILGTASSCMSPMSMLLTGFLLGRFPLKQMLSSSRAYWLTGVRLLLIPFVFAGFLLLLGVRGAYFLHPLVIVSLPLGLNLVVFPESYGLEEIAQSNARVCFVSYLLALVILPVTFALITNLAGL